MAIARDNATTATAASGSSLTFSHTVNSNTDGHITVVVCFRGTGPPTVSSVTYAGSNLSFVVGQTNTSPRVEVWAMTAPATGANNVVITFSANVDQGITAYAISHTGVDQTTPRGTPASAAASSSGPATVNVSSSSGELVVDGAAIRTQTATATVGAGQTQELNATGGSMRGCGSTEPGAGTVTMSWTLSGATGWTIAAVALKPSGGGGATPSERVSSYRGGFRGINRGGG